MPNQTNYFRNPFWNNKPDPDRYTARPAPNAAPAPSGEKPPERAAVAATASGGSQAPPGESDYYFLTSDEAADFLRLSRRTLERYRTEGTGPRFYKAGRGKRAAVRYRMEDLAAWMHAQSYQSTSEYPRPPS